MQMKYFKVTNNADGTICLAGRTRVEIPGHCKDLTIKLPDSTARATIARLKQRYPLLKIVEVAEEQPAPSVPASSPDVPATGSEQPQADAAPSPQGDTKTEGSEKAEGQDKGQNGNAKKK